MKNCFCFIFWLCALIFLPLMTFASELTPNYAESLQLAIDHSANPAGWTAPSLFVIPDTTVGTTEGLIYDGGKLIVRTATKSRNYKWNYVGQAGYKIYGSATTDAAWVTAGNDATRFLTASGTNGSNVTTILERGLGMDATGTHDAIIEYAVDTQYIMRPTRNPDITQYLPGQYGTNLPFVKPAGMTDAAYANFTAYYENWKTSAYGAYAFPWTQLGYTFFWGNGYTLAQINGMSEFIILGQSPVEIYGIYATQSYIYTRNDGSDFSSAASASYGNGFASFKIDGACDTVWAGHRFQKNVRTATAMPNQIVIESGGSVSGGQGLLIWSLNYDVINSGVISGATADKFGIAGTTDIALLFKGDTSTDYGTPITTAGAVNRLTNSGTISSPGTAVKAEAGNTVITNNAGGIISGGVYAIQTGAGNDTVTVNGGQITGRVDLGAGTDSFTVMPGSNAKLNFTLNKATATTAAIANAETVTIADNTKIAVNVAGTSNISNNDQFLIVDTNTLAVTPANLTILTDSSLPMLSFSSVKSGNKLYLVASRNGTYYSTNSGNTSLGTVLDTLANTATGDMSAVLAELDKSGSAAYARKLEPIVNYGVIQAGYATMRQFNQTIAGRIEQLPAILNARENMMTGILAGDDPSNTGAWTQVFGSTMHQDGRDAVSGYNANVDGISVGLDRLLAKHFFAGFSFSYARDNITSSDFSTKTSAENSQGSLYGSLATEAYYLNVILSFAYNRYDSSRHIFFGGIDRTAKSIYDGNQYSGYLEGGYNFHRQGFKITPLASLQYLRIQLNDYCESGAGALNLSTDIQRYNVLQSGLGAKIAYPIQGKNVQIIPELHARWLYDFIGDPQQTTSQFTGGGATFAAKGLEPPQSSYNFGAKLNILTEYGVTLSLDYDLEIKHDFHSHNGYINVRYEF
ncbi:MAG: autotransporter domain-containing protein [Smithellaceae bacterium]